MQTIHHQRGAHQSAISTMKTREDDHIMASGDDDGTVKLWDLRKREPVFEWKDNEDYISCLAVNESKNMLLATGGDGYLSVFQMRKGVLEARSDNMEDELLSIAMVKNGKKVLIGTQEGTIDIFSWDWWGDLTDRFVGHPSSVSSIVAIDDDTVCTSSSDGIIRICSVQPNKLLGIIGQHARYPVEQLRLSRDKRILAR
jgi:WD40 repeat protein